MSVEARCGNCRKVVRLAESMAGKKVRCPTCKGVISVPASDDHLEVQWGDEGPAKSPNRPIGAEPEPEAGGPVDAGRERDVPMHRMPSFGAKKPGFNLQFLIKPLVFFGVIVVVGWGGYKVYQIVAKELAGHQADEDRSGGMEEFGKHLTDPYSRSPELEDDSESKRKKERK